MRTVYATLLISLLVVGCASTGGHRLPDGVRNEANLYYVQHQPKDGRNLHNIIAEAMRDRGFNAMAGLAEDQPPNAEYYVRYEDRWAWDMRMYLLFLQINIHEASSGNVIGYGRSYQPSLSAMGMSFRDVIDRALEVLLEGR